MHKNRVCSFSPPPTGILPKEEAKKKEKRRRKTCFIRMLKKSKEGSRRAGQTDRRGIMGDL